MTFLRVSILSIILILLGGCISIERPINKLTPFPPSPSKIKYTQDPIVLFDKNTQTYGVTIEFMHQMLNNNTFIDNVMTWKKINNVE